MKITPSQIHYSIPVLNEQRQLGNIQQIDLRNGQIIIIFTKRHLSEEIPGSPIAAIEKKETIITWN
jgi:hypothetical protein